MAWCFMLFMAVYVCFRYGIAWLLERTLLKNRLAGRQDKARAWQGESDRTSRMGKLLIHVADLIAAVGWSVRAGSFFSACLLLGVIGLCGGIVLFQSFRSAGLLAVMMGCLPYVVLRMRLVNRQMATRLEFLPAIELFYQSYLITGCRHIRTALQKTVEERRLPGEVQSVFDQLYRHLSVRGDDEESLRRFSLAFGHMWADYFVSIIRVALTEGNNISDNLKELIGDMRKAQLANQQERHRMLEIRLANFTPALFLALFLGINFRMNPEGSYQSYVLDPIGRGMLLNALALLFGSLLMGVYLSRRKL